MKNHGKDTLSRTLQKSGSTYIGKIKRAYHERTLFQKMMFFYVALLCVPVFLIGSFYIGSISEKMNREYRNGKEEILQQKETAIESSLSRIRYCTAAFQYNSGLIEYVDQYDFSTADGAESWLRYVQPAFSQIDFSNPEFTDIRIWRLHGKESNDPRYVLNASDNPEISGIEPISRKMMKLVIQEEDTIRQCHIYQVLYDLTGFNKVGYVEVVCDIGFLLSPLQFLQEGERLYCEMGERVWEVKPQEDGTLCLEISGTGLPKGGNRASLAVGELGMTLHYYYEDLVIWSNATVVTVGIGALIMFGFFTAVYYAFYRSITRRIKDLTDHMLHYTTERMQPYRTDLNRDGIGMMTEVYNQIAEKVNALNDEILQKERLANQAQYYAMQSQIHPHFLYNTLENIDMLIEVGENEKASRMMAAFGKILRYNLSRRREMASLKDELNHTEDYLKLYSYRMRDDFEWKIGMEPGCRNVMCPYCMMQPVVENCFKHGFQDPERQLWVHIRVYEDGGFVWIEIEDNGEGISGERMQEIEHMLEAEAADGEGAETGGEVWEFSVGLRNVRDRIRLMCREGSDLWISSGAQGCLVRIAIRI